MTKSTISVLLAAGVALGASAQSKMNSAANVMLMDYEQGAEIRTYGTDGQTTSVGVLVLMKSGCAPEKLTAYDATVDWFDGEIAGVTVPLAKLEAMSEDENVEYVEYTPDIRPLLDFARQSTGVTDVQNGFEFNSKQMSFTGKGVLTGLMDTGIDPNHINFMGEDGETRVKAMFAFSGTNGVASAYTTPEQIAGFTTDTQTESHGTHVAGIMAGSYNGLGNYGYITSANGKLGKKAENEAIPYYGVATGSSIAMAGGSLSNNNITGGMRKIFDLAEELNMPCVVNLSLGSNSGPHDGTDLLARSVATQAKRGIVTVSSGNEGDYAMFVGKTFTATDKELKTFLENNTASGTIDIWGADETPFKVSVILYANTGGKITEVCSVEAKDTKATSSSSTLFNTNYSGTASMSATVNRTNNRFNVSLSLNASKSKDGYNLGIVIEGSEGQTVYVYGVTPTSTSNGSLFTSNNLSGWSTGTGEGSINALACSEGVIAVGAYISRTSWPNVSGRVTGYTGTGYTTIGEIAPFSSWGEKVGSGWLPNVCGPGANIVSSLSTYYVNRYSASLTLTAQAENGTKTNYWGPMQGTSMSSPFVAGVIALWLEANPELTTADVLNIINETSEKPEIDDNTGGIGGGITIPGLGGSTSTIDESKKWGAGKINALAGIKKILEENSGVNTVEADDAEKSLIVEGLGGKRYRVFVGGTNGFTANLYNLQGALVTSVTADNNSVEVDASTLSDGIYLLEVQGKNVHASRKIVVK